MDFNFENLNLINILFLQLTFVIVVLGSLMNLIEKYLPTSIKQMFRYGKHALKGEKSDKLVESIEIPKSWFSHFYNFALIWSWSMTILAISVYFYDYQPPKAFIAYLDFSCGKDRKVESKF
jgi:3-oxo-5-alpha-steroid 4-dehydrogenase 3